MPRKRYSKCSQSELEEARRKRARRPGLKKPPPAAIWISSSGTQARNRTSSTRKAALMLRKPRRKKSLEQGAVVGMSIRGGEKRGPGKRGGEVGEYKEGEPACAIAKAWRGECLAERRLALGRLDLEANIWK